MTSKGANPFHFREQKLLFNYFTEILGIVFYFLYI